MATLPTAISVSPEPWITPGETETALDNGVLHSLALSQSRRSDVGQEVLLFGLPLSPSRLNEDDLALAQDIRAQRSGGSGGEGIIVYCLALSQSHLDRGSLQVRQRQG